MFHSKPFLLTADEANELLWHFSSPDTVDACEEGDRLRGGVLARLVCRIAASDVDGAGQWAQAEPPLWALKGALHVLDHAKDLTPKPEPKKAAPSKPTHGKTPAKMAKRSHHKKAAAAVVSPTAAAGTRKALGLSPKPNAAPRRVLTDEDAANRRPGAVDDLVTPKGHADGNR